MCLQRLFEKCAEKHKDSLNLLLHIIAFIVFIYGLWVHSLEWILVAVLIAVIGHIIEEINKKRAMKNTKKEKQKPKRKRKTGALEMSIGTIVIMVIAVTMLILGIVFVRSIMCKGIQMTDKLNEGVMNEISKLFGSGEYGVKCMGEDEDITFGTGGKRAFGCVIVEDKASHYKIDVTKMESDDVSQDQLDEWLDFKPGYEGDVIPGKNQNVVVIKFDIPRDAPSTSIKITMQAVKDSGSPQTIYSYINIKPTNFATDAMC